MKEINKEFFSDNCIIHQEVVAVITDEKETFGVSIIIGKEEAVLELEQLKNAVTYLEGMTDD